MISGRVFNILEEEQTWPSKTVKETAKLLDVGVKHKFTDPFGRIDDAFLVIEAPFCYIDNPQMANISGDPGENAVLNERVQQEIHIRTSAEEFEQQHKAHGGQRFAAIRLLKTSRNLKSTVGAEDIHLPGTSILMLESTGAEEDLGKGGVNRDYIGVGEGEREGSWRRVGFFPVAVPFQPDKNDMSVRFLEEMKRAKWEWKEVRIV